MEKDQQKGHGHWTGCHTFTNIVCDGEPSRKAQSRDGALKMGGTYWYFYKLDGDAEYHDPKVQSTTTCPLLPGQTVNILEVPVETSTLLNIDCSSVDICSGQALNPNNRYAKLRAPLKRKRPASGHCVTSSTGRIESIPDQWMAKSIGRLKSVASETLIRVHQGLEKPAIPRLTRHLSLGRNLISASGMQTQSGPELDCSRRQSRAANRPRTRHGSHCKELEPLRSRDSPNSQEASQRLSSSLKSKPHDCHSQQLETLAPRVPSSEAHTLAYSLLPSRPGKQSNLRDAFFRDLTSPFSQPKLATSSTAQSHSTITHSVDDNNPQSCPVSETPPPLSGKFSPDTSPMSILTPSPHRRLAEPRILPFMDHHHEVDQSARPVGKHNGSAVLLHGSESAHLRLDSPIVVSQENFGLDPLRGSSQECRLQLCESVSATGRQDVVASIVDDDVRDRFFDMEKNWRSFSFTSAPGYDHAFPPRVNDRLSINHVTGDDLLQDLGYLGAFIV